MAKAIGTFTITAVNDGTDGQNVVQAILTNESHTLAANSSGTPTSYTGCETTIYVYDGATDVTSQYTIARTASSGITTSITSNTIKVTKVTNDVGGTVTITATKGSTVLTKVFTISISKAGTNGTAVTITTQNVQYKLTDDATQPTSGWNDNVPVLAPNKYLWTKTYVKYSDNTETTSYSVSYIGKDGTNGEPGQPGADGRGISSTTIDYAKSTNGQTAPSSGWQSTIPALDPSEYLWTRTVITYTTGNPTTSYSVGMKGATGQQGPQGNPGAAGADAKLVIVNPSSQVFKSTKGSTGTFDPQYIYLYPTFQGCSYSKWQYSTNGTTWTNVTSGSNSLTIGTYNSIANSLRIERTCNLYTDSITAVSFRCVSNTSTVYDTVTVIKVYDTVDLKVGGRNYVSNLDYNWVQGNWSIPSVGEKTVISAYNSRISLVKPIEVEPNTDYWIKVYSSKENINALFRVCDSDDNFIRSDISLTNQKWTSGPNDKYLHLTVYDNSVVSDITNGITKIKFEKGNTPTDWSPSPEDSQQEIYASNELINGTQTSQTYTWKGKSNYYPKLKDGDTITYFLPYNSGGDQVSYSIENVTAGTTSTNKGAVLDLTLADGSTTGNVPIYYGTTTRVTTHFSTGSVIRMTYREPLIINTSNTQQYRVDKAWVTDANYDSGNTRENCLPYFAGKTGATGIWATSLFMEDKNGTYQGICTASDGTITTGNRTSATTKKANVCGYRVNSTLYYSTTAYNKNVNISGNNVIYSNYGLFDSRYTLNTTLTAGSLTAYKPLYFVGTIHSDGFFYLDTTWWTQTPTTNNKIYILVGACYDSTTSNCRIVLYENNPWYICSDGVLKELNQEYINQAIAIAQQALDESVIRSATEPDDPSEGMLWYDTTTNQLFLYTSNQWRAQDMSQYAKQSDISDLRINRNKTWITQPTVPYYAGDLWIVQDTNDPNFGKILTCVTSKTDSEDVFSIDDWITPLTSYTTVDEMTNVLGTDPREWSSTSKSLTTLINENTEEIEGQKGQISSLAVRASGIEMSFSRTGTMNFLGNSSGQNNVKGWTLSNTSQIGAVSASAASDINQSLVSLSAFRMAFTSSVKELTMTSDLFTPPTSDIFTVSAKFKVPGKYTYITLTVNLYSDMAGSTSLGTRVLNVPYAVNAEDEFLLYHMSINKHDFASFPQSAKIVIKAYQDTSDSRCLTTNPNNDKGKIASAGKLYKYNSTYTYLKPVYKKVSIVSFSDYLSASNLVGDAVYHCEKDMIKDSLSDSDYVRGTYYTIAENAQASSKKLKPITDGYTIMMLDSGDYYTITMNGTTENIETSSTAFPVSQYSTIYIGDIMVNGGQNVQTWTPRQDENLWGENIKFDYSGITIENIPNGYKRIIDSNSDIAYQINDSGAIVKCIWKLTQDGFITNDIKCIGTFAMGYVSNEASADLENTFTAVMEMKKNTDRDGIDEYLYVNN